MVKAKNCIRILNASGGCGCTSGKRALKLISNGRARYVDEFTIEMISAKALQARALAKRPVRHSPRVVVDVNREFLEGCESMRTFAPYPHPGAWIGALQ